MPASICPRCKHVNPEYAIYCHFDGVVLQAQQNALNLRLPSEFAFPSGRRCRTFDELAQGCQEEWSSARDLLMRGVFAQFFRSAHRADLVRAADDARAQSNPDIALTTFLTSLPGTRTQTPKLDLHPRRILIGTALVGETKSSMLTLTNRGQGMLQGTVTVTEGQDWLSLSETKVLHELPVEAAREQTVKLTINTKGVAAGQTYGAKLTVVTNGGVVEVPLRMDLVAQPFPKPPFQGLRSQREFAEKVRLQPKAAVAILESGDVQRWYALNGWTYPVRGTPVKGVGGVQQFFEGMGVSKPPAVQLEFNGQMLKCRYKETMRSQATLKTDAKKWVYAQVTSDRPWLKVSTPEISGPQKATAAFEVDSTLWNQGPAGEGNLTFVANGGQTLTLNVKVEIQGLPSIQPARPGVPIPRPPTSIAPGVPPSAPARSRDPDPTSIAEGPARLKYLPAMITTVLLCFCLRLAMVPLSDFLGMPSAAASAAQKLGVPPAANAPFSEFGGWLRLPWLPILGGSDNRFSAAVFQPDNAGQVSISEYRHYFATYFIRWLVLRTWWIGAVIGAIIVMRRGGPSDLPWGIIAGAFAGLGVSATVAAFFLVLELVPHLLWYFIFGDQGGGFGYLMLWSLLALVCWLFIAVILGVVLPLLAPLRRLLIDPIQTLLANAFGLLGMRTLSEYWNPS